MLRGKVGRNMRGLMRGEIVNLRGIIQCELVQSQVVVVEERRHFAVTLTAGHQQRAGLLGELAIAQIRARVRGDVRVLGKSALVLPGVSEGHPRPVYRLRG